MASQTYSLLVVSIFQEIDCFSLLALPLRADPYLFVTLEAMARTARTNPSLQSCYLLTNTAHQPRVHS